MIRHFVHLRPCDGADLGPALQALAAFNGTMPGILAFETRDNVSPEIDVVRGFSQVFWFDFEDAAARDAYLVDPDHQAIGAQLVALCGGVNGIFVCDIEV